MTRYMYLNQCRDCKMVFMATIPLNCPFCGSINIEKSIIEIVRGDLP